MNLEYTETKFKTYYFKNNTKHIFVSLFILLLSVFILNNVDNDKTSSYTLVACYTNLEGSKDNLKQVYKCDFVKQKDGAMITQYYKPYVYNNMKQMKGQNFYLKDAPSFLEIIMAAFCIGSFGATLVTIFWKILEDY